MAGVPRSGTTWTAQVLSHTRGATYVHEPDNHRHSLYALRAKRGLGAFPFLRPGDRADRYERLWQYALESREPRLGWRRELADRVLGHPSFATLDLSVTPAVAVPSRVRLAARLAPAPTAPRPPPSYPVVKSVQVLLALEWLAARFDVRVLLVQRHPLNVVSSWLQMGFDELGPLPASALDHYADRWQTPPPPAHAPRLRRISWRVGFYTAVVEDLARANPRFIRASHESLCLQPIEEFREIARSLGLEWTEEATHFVMESNRPGYSYDTHRLTAEQPNRWRERLSAEERAEILGVLASFPLGSLAEMPPAQF